MRITKTGQLIQSVEDWFQYAPPNGGADPWRGGRGAKEFAQVWVESGSVTVPDELLALLASHPDTMSALLESGKPEARIAFDRRVGEVRNANFAPISTRQASSPRPGTRSTRHLLRAFARTWSRS